jgi:hypothetical protein
MSAWKLLPRTAEKHDRQLDAWSEAAAKHHAKLGKLEQNVPGYR